MKVCTLFSEELSKALIVYLTKQYPGGLFTSERVQREDSIAYQFEVEVQRKVSEISLAALKTVAAHFINGYVTGLEQCATIVRGEGEWERDAVQASRDNL